MKKFTCFFLFVLSVFIAGAEQFYVNPRSGNDANPGTKEQPLKTINEAARRVNGNKSPGATEIILTEGIHLVTTTAKFDNNKYTVTDRLVIRAEVMPGDKDWNPQRMPVIVTIVPLKPGFGGDEAIGLQVEVDHVTIEGLRFSGSPDYSYKNEKELRRSYPVWRGGKSLDDLLVTQCLFAGNKDVMPLHVGVIANGHGLVIDHCVFFNCKNPVVFWQADSGTSYRNAMRYCLVYGCYFSGVWTTESTNGDDFDFHHNIIANCKTAWICELNSPRQYKAHDCIFTGNTRMTGYGSGPLGSNNSTSIDFLKTTNVITTGTIQIEMDQGKPNYLQLAEGSFGTNLGAGLFK
ncbi:MAG: right-handed parallel beta-helix repeat-containing protein [Bacteroidota bacterium]|nr:right-handed parallel beta-helix repeat-containing protein [Bacteroidota bacterium]